MRATRWTRPGSGAELEPAPVAAAKATERARLPLAMRLPTPRLTYEDAAGIVIDDVSPLAEVDLPVLEARGMVPASPGVGKRPGAGLTRPRHRAGNKDGTSRGPRRFDAYDGRAPTDQAEPEGSGDRILGSPARGARIASANVGRITE